MVTNNKCFCCFTLCAVPCRLCYAVHFNYPTMVLLAAGCFLTYRIYRHYTNKPATATEPNSPPKPCSPSGSAALKPCSHSGTVMPKSCSPSGLVLAYQGVSYSRLPRPMSTLKPAASMLDAQRCPALSPCASMTVTELVGAPAAIMGVRLSKDSFTTVSEACTCGIARVARVLSCPRDTSLLPAYCVCRVAHIKLAQQHSTFTIWALAAWTVHAVTASPAVADMLPLFHGPYPDTCCCAATLLSHHFVCRLRLMRW